jgi:cation diffusion facilitator CzcD-associated flavoprotein CzcO
VTEQAVIVGAGPAGLAVAAELGRRGVPYAILECGSSVGSAWRGRYDSLRLHTARGLSGLPGAPIPRRFGQWVARDDLVRYLEAYAQRFGIRPEFGVEVGRIDPVGTDWRLRTSAGERSAAAVVVATGMARTPYRPDWSGQEGFPGSLVHAADYREPSAYRDRTVLVVGAGNSAAEIAVEVAEVAASVLLSVRTPPNIVRRDILGVPSQVIGVALSRLPGSVLNPVLGLLRRATVPDLRGFGLPAPSGNGYSQFLRSQTVPILDHGFVAAIREHRIAVVPEVTGFAGGRVRLADGQTVAPDDVIDATGYRPALEGMVGHLGVLDERGLPKARGARTVPGCDDLYFVGISVQLSGLLREIGHEARAVAGVLADRGS